MLHCCYHCLINTHICEQVRAAYSASTLRGVPAPDRPVSFAAGGRTREVARPCIPDCRLVYARPCCVRMMERHFGRDHRSLGVKASAAAQTGTGSLVGKNTAPLRAF